MIAADLGVMVFSGNLISSLDATSVEGSGTDSITVGAGAAVAVGGLGNDSITATGGTNHVLIGDLANVAWLGGVIRSVITVAAAGDSIDTITGGTGNETMIGGSGADVIKSHAGQRWIRAVTLCWATMEPSTSRQDFRFPFHRWKARSTVPIPSQLATE